MATGDIGAACALPCPPHEGAGKTGTGKTWRSVCAAHGGAILLFTALTIASAPGLAIHPASAVTPDLVDPVHHIWSVGSLLHTTLAWRDGLWSPFDGNIYYPAPHAASFADIFLGLLPLLLPLSPLVRDPAALATILAGLSFVLSAYGAFLLGRKLTDRYAAGLIGGLVFGFSPLHYEQIGHVTVASMEWQALAAYALTCAWQRPSWWRWGLAGVCLGLSAVTNLYYLAYLTGPLLVVAALLRRSWTGERLRGAVAAAAIAALMTAPILVPYLTRHAAIDGAYGGATSTDVRSFAQALAGRPVDGLVMPSVPFQAMQAYHGLFPGIAPLILACVAWRRRRARLWGIFALCCAALALGPHLAAYGHTLPIPLPYALLSGIIPHFALFRDPTRALAGSYLGLSVLAAHGARAVLARVEGMAPPRRGLVGAALVALVAAELWTSLPVARLAPIPDGERWLAGQARIHAIVELPVSNATMLDWQHQTEIMRDSTVHWKAMVNGSESVDPVGAARDRAILGTYPSRASLRLLRQLGIDAVVLRLPWLSPEQQSKMRRGCRVAYRDAVEEICLGPWTRAP